MIQTQMAPQGQLSSSIQAWGSGEVVCFVLTLKRTNVVSLKPKRQVWMWHLKSRLRQVGFCGSSACTPPQCFVFKGNTVQAGSLHIPTCRLGTTPDPAPTPGPGGQQPFHLCSSAPSPAQTLCAQCLPCGIPAHGLAPHWSIYPAAVSERQI